MSVNLVKGQKINLSKEVAGGLTNPRHKYWETRKIAENAVRNFMSRRCNVDRQLEVVEIECKIHTMDRE